MRKSKLLELNDQLFNDLERYKALSQTLIEENKELKAKLENFSEISKPEIEVKPKVSPEDSNSKPPTELVLEDDTAYGAKIIGQVVVSAAKFCNALTSGEPNENTKEMINLILGRTEVAKAEILKQISSHLPLEDKKSAINNEKSDAEDYFIRIMAQKE